MIKIDNVIPGYVVPGYRVNTNNILSIAGTSIRVAGIAPRTAIDIAIWHCTSSTAINKATAEGSALATRVVHLDRELGHEYNVQGAYPDNHRAQQE